MSKVAATRLPCRPRPRRPRAGEKGRSGDADRARPRDAALVQRLRPGGQRAAGHPERSRWVLGAGLRRHHLDRAARPPAEGLARAEISWAAYRVPGGIDRRACFAKESIPSLRPRSASCRWSGSGRAGRRLVAGSCWGSGLKAALIEAALPAGAPACAVTTSALASRRYGGSRLWVTLPAGGSSGVQRNQPDDGTFGTKLGWIPDRTPQPQRHPA